MIEKTNNTIMINQISMKKRTLIIIYDFVLLLASLLFVDAIAVTLINGGKEPLTGFNKDMLAVINALVVIFYFVGFWYYKNTPAMKIWRVTMVAGDYQNLGNGILQGNQNHKVSFTSLIIRFLVPVFTLGGSFIYGIFNKGTCLHDKLSQTYLVPVKFTKKSSK